MLVVEGFVQVGSRGRDVELLEVAQLDGQDKRDSDQPVGRDEEESQPGDRSHWQQPGGDAGRADVWHGPRGSSRHVGPAHLP